MTTELLHKFLNNNCSADELREVIRWIKSDALSKDGKSLNLGEWQKYQGGDYLNDETRYNSMLDKIHHKINISQADFPEKKETKKVTLTTWITRAAAILLLPVVAFLFYTLSRNNFEIGTGSNAQIDILEVVAPIGSKTNFVLSDGTKVFLNHGSSLRYPTKFSKKIREVELKGEGYFKVAHNPAKPFTVKTKNINVTALGTEFNVFAYPNEDIAEATLVNGKVAVEKITKAGDTEMLGEMVPGQHISYNSKTDKVTGQHGDIEKYISWREGKLIFKNDPIDQIAKRLSRWYNVDIEFADEKVKHYTYTATFFDETLSQILDLLEIATPINYKLENRKKLPNGTFSKQKVIIEIKN